MYALEVFEFRDKQRRQQLSDSMSKMNLKTNEKPKASESDVNRVKSGRDGLKSESRSVNSIHLNPGEILKPLPKMSDNHNISDNSIDPNVNIKRKIVKDFESDTSSPFDYVELQTIDDMQELNDVFQAFQSKSGQTKQNINENNFKNNSNFSEFNNSLNQMNCEQNLSFIQNMNGMTFVDRFGYNNRYNNTDTSFVAINMTNSGPTMTSNNLMTTVYPKSESTGFTTDYNSIGRHSTSETHNNLRSSKSASDLPTLVKREESVTNLGRRQRSHTPPCALTKSKNKKYLNSKQTLVLNDPYEELSVKSKELVDSISSMGFDRSRVSRAVKHMDNDHKKVIDFLIQIQTLEESGYDSCEAEVALHMNSHRIPDVITIVFDFIIFYKLN